MGITDKILEFISFGMFLSIASFVQIWMMGNKWLYAPSFGLFLQLFWFYYAVYIIHDYCFIFGVVGFSSIHIRNQIKWIKENKDEPTKSLTWKKRVP